MEKKNKFPNCKLEVVEVDGKKKIKASCADMDSAVELQDLLSETVNITVEPKGGRITSEDAKVIGDEAAKKVLKPAK